MSKHYVRVWKELDVEEIKKHLLVMGQASGLCENCNTLIPDYKQNFCPNCQTKFQYVTLRSELGQDASFYRKLNDIFKDFICIDYSDYKKLSAKAKAKDIFK